VLSNVYNTIGLFIVVFHLIVIVFCIIIGIVVLTIFIILITSVWFVKLGINFQVLEYAWTLYPIIILLCIGIPSLILLYTYDLEGFSQLTVKVVAHQWYWTYSYCDLSNLEFDRYIKPLEDLNNSESRLLITDNSLVIPFGVEVCFIVTSSDVIHAWALPSIRLKVDATPGLLTTIHTTFIFPGLYYGQCREICGANHRFIPICVEVTSSSLFKSWIISL